MLICKTEQCTGCSLCMVNCNKNAIRMILDEDGFLKAVCDQNKCNDCGLCNKVCPSLQEEQDINDNPVKAYVFYDFNKENLKKSSSGGIAGKLAEKAYSQNYKVCGAIYSAEDNKVKHVICRDEIELEKLRGSKYMQSWTADAFEELKKKEKYIVFGTPCQIAGIDRMARIKKRRDDFILVDFYCHGVPTAHLWTRFYEGIKRKYPKEKIKEVFFRDKEAGWGSFNTKFVFENGKVYVNQTQADLYHELFLSNICLNEVCYRCNYRYRKSSADIRIGDFWSEKYKDNKEGVSSVLVYSESGDQLVQSLENCFLEEENIETVLEGQIEGGLEIPSIRKRMIKELEKEQELEKIKHTWFFIFRLQRKIKRLMKK